MQKIVIICLILLHGMAHATKKILIVTNNFPPPQGRAVLNQIITLCDAGYDVYVSAIRPFPLIDSDVLPIIEKYSLIEKTTYEKEVSNIAFFDIVLAQTGQRGVQCARIIDNDVYAVNRKPLLITCFRGADITQDLDSKKDDYTFLMNKGDLFLPVCDYFKNILLSLGFSRSKIITLHSAIDCSFFSFIKPSLRKKKPMHVVSVCRLVEKKGLEYALRAIAHLQHKYPTIKYTIVGDGALETYLKEYAAELGIANNVYFVGKRSHTYIATLLQKAHVFILPSVTSPRGDQEGIPNAGKEAMSCGTPVVLTDHAGNSELITHGTGFLVPERDVSALIKRIDNLLSSPKLCDSLALKARKRVKKQFSYKKISKQLIRIIQSLK